MPPEGLPHSEIPGSKPVCGSPRLIAACHVLHRFSAPRHPPSTLSSLTIKYLRRESFLFLPTLLSKIAITADQKAPLRTMSLEELSHPHDWPRRSLRDRRPNVLRLHGPLARLRLSWPHRLDRAAGAGASDGRPPGWTSGTRASEGDVLVRGGHCATGGRFLDSTVR